MSFLTGLIAVALLGADGSSAEGSSSPIVYEIKVLDMRGVDWRAALHTKLQPVSRQGGATVWTAEGDVGPRLVGICEKVVAAPKVTSDSVASVMIRTAGTWRLATDSKFGEPTQVTQAAYGPAAKTKMDVTFNDTKTGLSVMVRGRKLDQGVLANLSISDKQVTTLHTVALTDVAPPPQPAIIQVPEVTECDVSGEWLIPNDDVLIVSLGVHTINESGKAVVKERLALIQAKETSAQPEMRAVYNAPKTPVAAPTTKGYMNSPIRVTTTTTQLPFVSPSGYQPAVPATPLARLAPIPWPVAPSLALPEARNASGEPIALPPLPENTPVTKLPGSSEPCATPQIHAPQATPSDCCAGCNAAGTSATIASAPKRDARTTPASASSPAMACCEDEEQCCLDQNESGSQPRSYRFLVRLNKGINLEIKAFVKPMPASPGSN
jgi:hypothetical protein